LLKYDFDGVGAYAGYSRLLYFLGVTERPYIESGQGHHFAFAGLLLA
jgi:hypothetical protein